MSVEIADIPIDIAEDMSLQETKAKAPGSIDDVITLHALMVLQPGRLIKVWSSEPFTIRIGDSSPVIVTSTALNEYTAPSDAHLRLEPLKYPDFPEHWDSLPLELKEHILTYDIQFEGFKCKLGVECRRWYRPYRLKDLRLEGDGNY